MHGLKNLKNMVCSRDLIYDGEKLSWNVIIKLFYHLKEGFANSRNVHQVRHMRFSIAFQDQFTKQNVSDANNRLKKQQLNVYSNSWQIEWVV